MRLVRRKHHRRFRLRIAQQSVTMPEGPERATVKAGRDIIAVLRCVHWMQTLWMIDVGVVLLATPRRRFGTNYRFITESLGLQCTLAALYLTGGLVLLFGLLHHWPKAMAFAMRIGGLLNVAFSVLLLINSQVGPTGLLGSLFALYVGVHMLIQSVLLKRAT